MALLFIDGFDAYGTAGNDISSVLEEVGWVLTYQVSVGVQESSDNGTGYGLSCNVASYHPGYWGRMAQYFPIRSGAIAGFRRQSNGRHVRAYLRVRLQQPARHRI